ncbi:unnamed protein product, partial [Ectocarpus sp. 12 AP-2014]
DTHTNTRRGSRTGCVCGYGNDTPQSNRTRHTAFFMRRCCHPRAPRDRAGDVNMQRFSIPAPSLLQTAMDKVASPTRVARRKVGDQAHPGNLPVRPSKPRLLAAKADHRGLIE